VCINREILIGEKEQLHQVCRNQQEESSERQKDNSARASFLGIIDKYCYIQSQRIR
jgi:hypothetical protein